MLLTVLKSKIHLGRITHCEVDYEGSIAIDREFMDKTGILPFEKVLVANVENGARFETYVIEGERGSKILGLNGAAALNGTVGDRIIIFAFALVDQKEASSIVPQKIILNEQNEVVESSSAH